MMKFTAKHISATIEEVKNNNENIHILFEQLEKDLEKYADSISPADRVCFIKLAEIIAAESYKSAIYDIFDGSVWVDVE
jgi:hypothetical protein